MLFEICTSKNYFIFWIIDATNPFSTLASSINTEIMTSINANNSTVPIESTVFTIAPTTMKTHNLSANLTIVTNVTCFVKFQNEAQIKQVNCLDASKLKYFLI